MKRTLMHDGPEAAFARQAEEGALRTDAPPQPNAQLDELSKTLQIKRAKLSAGFVLAKFLIKKKTLTYDSELSKLQQNTAEEIAKLHAMLSCENVGERHLNTETKQAVERMLLLLRCKFDRLLAVQEEQNAEAADLKSHVVAILNGLAMQIARMKHKIPEEYKQMTELLNCQSDANITEILEDNRDHAEDKHKIMEGLERNKTKNDQLSVRLDQPEEDIPLVRREWEKKHTNRYEKHVDNITALGKSARDRERESTKQIYLDQIAQIMKMHESELSELQKKLDTMLSEQRVEYEAKLLAQVAEHDKEIKNWEFQLEHSRQQSICYREKLEKAHREEVSNLQNKVDNTKLELVALQKKATGWKTDLDQLSEDHNALKDTHSRQLFGLGRTGEPERNLALFEKELEERRSREKELASWWQNKLAQANDEIERYKGLLYNPETGSEMQLTQAKDEIEHYKELLNNKDTGNGELIGAKNELQRCKWLLHEATTGNEDLKTHHSQILEQISAQHSAETHSLKQAISAATNEANSTKMRLLSCEIASNDGIAFRDKCIGQLQRDLHAERNNIFSMTAEKNKLLSDQNTSQQENENRLAEMTQLRMELDRLRNENLEKTAELKTLREKVSLNVKRMKKLMETKMETKMETTQDLESQDHLVVARLQNDLDAFRSKSRETVAKLETEKASLQNKTEALEEQLEQLKQLRLEDNAERHEELTLALKGLEQELSERLAFSDLIGARLSTAEDKVARSCSRVENFAQQHFHILRNMEASTAQTAPSDLGLFRDTVARVVIPRNNGESEEDQEEDQEEQMLQHVLRECEELEKLISDESAELRAEEDEFRTLDAKHMGLMKEYGDWFTWKAGKQKQGKAKGSLND